MQTQITRQCVIEEETKEFGEKPLHRPPSSHSNKVSQNRVLSSFLDLAIHLIASAKPHRLLLAIPQNFPSSKTLSTL